MLSGESRLPGGQRVVDDNDVYLAHALTDKLWTRSATTYRGLGAAPLHEYPK